MLVYFGILIIILIVCAFPSNSNRKNNIKLLFCIILIFLFMALRLDFGGDYEGYVNLYNEVQLYKTSDFSESGFVLLNKIMPSFRMLLGTTSLLFCGALFFLYKRYISPKYWAFAFLVLFISKYMLLGNISGIRNSIAVSAFIFGFYFIEQNRKILYILLLILASFFHTSALFFLPLVIVNPNRLSKTKSQLLWWVCILFAILTTLYPKMINSFSIWLISNIDFFSRYEVYMDEQITFGYRGLSFILIFFMLYLNINTLKHKDLTLKENLLIKLSLFFYIIMLLPGIGLLSRMYFYLSFPQMGGNIYVVSRIANKQVKWAYVFGMLILPSMEFYYYAVSEHFYKYILHYHSILFQ